MSVFARVRLLAVCAALYAKRAHKVNEDHESCMGGYLVCVYECDVCAVCADNFENTEFRNRWTHTNRIVWHNFSVGCWLAGLDRVILGR